MPLILKLLPPNGVNTIPVGTLGTHAMVAPVPVPPTKYSILAIATFLHLIWLLVPTAVVRAIVASPVTVSVPPKAGMGKAQGPVGFIIKLNTPDTVGVPEIVIIPPA